MKEAVLAIAPELSEKAARVAALFEEPVTAEEVARYLRLGTRTAIDADGNRMPKPRTDWVHAHDEELGGFRLGAVPKAHWRFYLSEVRARLSAPQPTRREAKAPTESRARPRRQQAKPGFAPDGIPLIDLAA